jgi:CubicO group peptidase (beta-lactamase class C family)
MIMRRRVSFALLVCLGGLSPFGAGAQSNPAESLESSARRIAEQYNLPGLSIAVAGPGGLARTEVVGRADLEHDIAVTPSTRFRMGSLSKLVTVAAVARLAQEGSLDLEAAVRQYVPYVPEWATEPTVRQLASHTAGIRHYLPKDEETLLRRPKFKPFETVREGLEIFLADPLVFDPGSAYGYSSYGYNLLSAVVEGAAGKPFLEYLREQITGPLGLSSITADHLYALVEDRTDFYHYHPESGGVYNVPSEDNSYKWASGGMLASAMDVAALARAFLEPGFFTAETLERVFTPQPNAKDADRGFDVGLGWRISRDAEGRLYYHHGGAIAGGRALVIAYPEEGIAVALMTNTYAPIGEEVVMELAKPFLAPAGDAS